MEGGAGASRAGARESSEPGRMGAGRWPCAGGRGLGTARALARCRLPPSSSPPFCSSIRIQLQEETEPNRPLAGTALAGGSRPCGNEEEEGQGSLAARTRQRWPRQPGCPCLGLGVPTPFVGAPRGEGFAPVPQLGRSGAISARHLGRAGRAREDPGSPSRRVPGGWGSARRRAGVSGGTPGHGGRQRHGLTSTRLARSPARRQRRQPRDGAPSPEQRECPTHRGPRGFPAWERRD